MKRGNGDDYNSSSSVYRGVRDRLMNLEFRAFQTCVVLWLGAKGYRHIRSLGRKAKRGRRSNPGADFIAMMPGTTNVQVAIQIRHWKTPVQRFVVDELRGYMLRKGLPLGLIVSRTRFTRKTLDSATEYSGWPVSLMSVAQLAGSMVGLELGVVAHGSGNAVDESFFNSLDCVSVGGASLPAEQSLHLESSDATFGLGDAPNQPNSQLTLALMIVGLVLLLVLILEVGR